MIYEALQPILNYFFRDICEDDVNFSLGDLFDPSCFQIRNAFFNTDIINSLHLPVELKAGCVGNVQLTGFAGIVTGTPLVLELEHLCLVLAHKPMDWNNELLLRYFKEFTLAFFKAIWNTSALDSQSKTPIWLKLIKNRVLEALDKMTIDIKYVHIRFESNFQSRVLAYGLYIQSVQFSNHDINTAIVNRRHLTESRNVSSTTSKLVSLSELAVYCDLDSQMYYSKSEESKERASIMRKQFIEFVSQHPFRSDSKHNILHLPGLWLKMDFSWNSQQNIPTLEAVDLRSVMQTIHIDFLQMLALQEEINIFLKYYINDAQSMWKPSSIDRSQANILPPAITVTSTHLFPIPLCTHDPQLVFTRDKQHRSREWMRKMWIHATRCILVGRRNGCINQVKFRTELPIKKEREIQQRRLEYIDLYQRSLKQDEIANIVLEKKHIKMSDLENPNTAKNLDVMLPEYNPLSLIEKWRFSDLKFCIPIQVQMQHRAKAEEIMRVQSKFIAAQRNERLVRSESSKSPKKEGIQQNLLQRFPSLSPTKNKSKSIVTEQTTSLNKDMRYFASTDDKFPSSIPDFPSNFIPNHHQLTADKTIHDNAISNSPLSSPKSHNKSPRKPELTSVANSHDWLKSIILPAWLIRAHNKKPLPFINWLLGPTTLAMYSFSDLQATSRNRLRFIVAEVGIENCLGCLLFSASTSSFLLEMRIGLFQGALYHENWLNHPEESGDQVENAKNTGWKALRNPAAANIIRSDYIQNEIDGFLYIGIRFDDPDFQSATNHHGKQLATCYSETNELTPNADNGQSSNHRCEVRAKICVGPVYIAYNEIVLQRLKSSMICNKNEHQGIASVGQNPTISIMNHIAVCWDSLVQGTKLFKSDSIYFGQLLRKSFYDEGGNTSDPLGGLLTNITKVENVNDQTNKQKAAAITRLINAVIKYPTSVTLEIGVVQLNLVIGANITDEVNISKNSTSGYSVDTKTKFAEDAEHVIVEFPKANFGIISQPQKSELHVQAAGVKGCFRPTMAGRKAAIDFIVRQLAASKIS